LDTPETPGNREGHNSRKNRQTVAEFRERRKKMTTEIISWISGNILFASDLETMREAVQDAVRQKAFLGGADLRGADLRGANLTGAHLGGADLRRAYLTGAYLGGAYLTGAYLGGATLVEANLTGANLRGATLVEANLTGADLQGADLGGADLRGADLTGANLTGTKNMVKIMGVVRGNIYWKRFGENLINRGYQYFIGLNSVDDFAADERVLCAHPGLHFASRSWCEVNNSEYPYEGSIRIPLDAKINEPWATDGKASADKIEILQVWDTRTGADVTDKFRRP
jgi:hypothetical protein